MEKKKYLFKELVVDSRTGLNPRKNFKLGHGDNYYITIKDIHDGEVVITDKTERIDDDAMKIINKRSRLKVGDVLFSSIGRIGETAIIREEPKNWNINESVFAFTVNKDLITPEFFRWMFKAPKYKNEIQRESTGSTFVSIKMNKLNELAYEIPSVNDQKDIVDELETISSLIKNCDLRIEKFDELIKTKFLMLFGDIYNNQREFEMVEIGKIAFVTKLAGFEYTQYINYKDHGDKIMVRGLNCKKGKLILDDVYYENNDVLDKLQRSKLNKGDVVMTYVGTIAETALIDEDDKYHLAPNVAKISLNDKEKNNPVFFVYMLVLFRDYIINFSTATSQPKISMDEIRKILVMNPPTSLQNEFAFYAINLEQLKCIVQKERNNLVELLNSKIDYYFGI